MKISVTAIPNSVVLLLVLALARCSVTESHLLVFKHREVSQKHVSSGPDHTLSYHLERLQTAGLEKPEEKKGRRTKIDDMVDGVSDKVEQAEFHPIDIFRGELCLAQHRMVVHSKCMNWLVEKCTGKYHDTGLCDRTRAAVKEDCEDPDNPNSEAACEWARLLGIDVNPRKKKEEKEEEKAEEKLEEKKTEEVPEEQHASAPAPATSVSSPAASAEAAVAAPPAPATAAPEAATNKAPAPAAEKKETATKAPQEEKVEKAEKVENPGYEDPQHSLTKGGLAAQGFSGKKVIHQDMETYSGDWQNEYGHHVEKKSGAQTWRVHPLLCLAIGAVVSFY